MTKILMIVLFAATIVLPQLASAHGVTAQLSVGIDGRLKTDSLSYSSEPAEIAGATFFTQEPGYSVHLGDNSVPDGALIAVSVLSPLYFSSEVDVPAGPDTNSSQLYIDGATDGRIASGGTSYLPPLVVAAYSPLPTADWHEHLFYTLEALGDGPSAYGVLLQAMSPNHPEILPSAPFAVIFNTGMDPTEFGLISAAMSRKLLSTGDLNFDWVVDIQDVTLAASHWLTTNAKGDANHDGIVDIQDITLIASRWLTTIGPGPGGYFPQVTPVPEPGAWVQATAAFLGLVVMTRRRLWRRRPTALNVN